MNTPDELFAALTEAVATALREMAGVECAPSDTAPAQGLVAVLPATTAAGLGFLGLRLPESTATELTRRVLAGAAEVDAAAVDDCVSEIVNVIAGQAKTLLHGTPYHFTLGTPRVESGAVEGDFVIPFGSEVGGFALAVKLPV